MSMVRLVMVAFGVTLLVGCATLPSKKEPMLRPVPEADRAVVARAIALGRAIYENDAASALAGDVATAGGIRRDARARGWVTRSDGSGFIVDFHDGAGHALYEVRLASIEDRSARLEPFDPWRPLVNDAAAMARAQATALEGLTPTCKGVHNVVTLPGALVGEDGWLIYLLPATTDPTARVMGGHIRVRVSADGTHLVDRTPLSKTCLIGAPPPDAKIAVMTVTEIISPTPTEVHVLASLLYKTPLLVLTRGRWWFVADGNVYLAELGQ